MESVNCPTHLDEIDQWLLDSFGIQPGDNPSARMVAEALWPKDKEMGIPIKERCGVLLRAAQQAVGKRLGNGREKENVLIRMFVAYRLRSEGYTCEAIAKLMGRNHSAVSHYVRKRIPDIQSLPSIYRSELDMFTKMNDILDKD